MKYAVPAGSARIKLLIALAARYTGCTARGWDVWDGLDTHPAFQISGRFCYSFGKTRIIAIPQAAWHGCLKRKRDVRMEQSIYTAGVSPSKRFTVVAAKTGRLSIFSSTITFFPFVVGAAL